MHGIPDKDHTGVYGAKLDLGRRQRARYGREQVARAHDDYLEARHVVQRESSPRIFFY